MRIRMPSLLSVFPLCLCTTLFDILVILAGFSGSRSEFLDRCVSRGEDCGDGGASGFRDLIAMGFGNLFDQTVGAKQGEQATHAVRLSAALLLVRGRIAVKTLAEIAVAKAADQVLALPNDLQ